MQIIELESTQEPSDQRLRDRFFRTLIADRTVAFLAFVGEEEAGLLVFERWPNSSIGIVEEIFVLERFARRGLGASLLAKAHAYALENGINRLQLVARHVERGRLSDDELIRWYRRHGFDLVPGHEATMSKVL